LPSGDDQSNKLADLQAALVAGSIDIALSGQMMLPADYLVGLSIEWTVPTALLFTNVSYTGRDRDKIDLSKLRGLLSADLDAFVAWAAAESRRLSLEFRIFSVVNPGPSPAAATNLVSAINAAGGRAVWDTGPISKSYEVMLGAQDHFAVGDSLASGTQAMMPGFDGIYLNIVANYDPPPVSNPKLREGQLWPIAGFTAKTG
jgi:hypothetical protein